MYLPNFTLAGPSDAPCPLYENTTIIEQPASFLTLHDKYVSAATSFIKDQSGNSEVYTHYIVANIWDCHDELLKIELSSSFVSFSNWETVPLVLCLSTHPSSAVCWKTVHQY